MTGLCAKPSFGGLGATATPIPTVRPSAVKRGIPVAGWGLHPLEIAALSRGTPEAEVPVKRGARGRAAVWRWRTIAVLRKDPALYHRQLSRSTKVNDRD